MARVHLSLFMVAAIGCFMAGNVGAFNHIVGGALGWSVPPNATYYEQWAKPRTFGVGDKLVFPFRSGVNNVIQISKKDYENCTQNEVVDMLHNGPTILLLNKTGDYFYFSGVGKHCELGQRLAITVTNEEGSSGAPFAFDHLSKEGDALAPPAPAPAVLPSSATSNIRSFAMVSALLTSLLSLFI